MYWAWFLLIPPATVLCLIVLFYLLLLIFLGFNRTAKIAQTTRRDLRGLGILIRMRFRCSRAFHRNVGIQRMFLDTVHTNPDKIAIEDISRGTSYTFKELNQLSCGYSRMLQGVSVKKGDVVCLLMENGAQFVAAWMGCAKLGAVSAWLNTNLRNEGLYRTLTAAKSTTIICSQSLFENLEELFTSGRLQRIDYRIFLVGGLREGTICVDELMTSLSKDEPKVESEPQFIDPLCYIYTSGTTGLPKAAVIKHFRYFYIATGGETAFGIRPKTDRIYICLPLYHTSAGVLGLGQTIMHGATCVIRSKFSARSFWKDCVQHNCTVSIYIGELLRYILLSPVCEEEKTHNIRLLIGNGLRQAIWRKFQDRFNIERIAEFYGSTEGTSNLVNIDGKEGSCGFMTILSLFSSLYPIRLFRVDEQTGDLLKDQNGYLVPIKPGESGALACTIKKNNPLYHFEGYLDRGETEKKIIRQPLPGAEPVFLSGDLLHWDRRGYFFFKDRLGDTYRWKGENVSTTEVESVLCAMENIEECTVYGVQIPGCEGRAGMASIVPRIDVDDVIGVLYEKLSAALPPYAVPLFIRVQLSLEKTGTFKMKKVDLQKKGFSEDGTSIVYYLDGKSRKYVELTDTIRDQIEKEEIKF